MENNSALQTGNDWKNFLYTEQNQFEIYLKNKYYI